MVTVTDFKKRQKENGEEFNVLILQGGVEFVKSESSGKFYATAKKASMVCTFDDDTCKALIGTKLPGSIQKEVCEPYEYEIPGSKETITLSHTYVFTPEAESMEESVFQEDKPF